MPPKRYRSSWICVWETTLCSGKEHKFGFKQICVQILVLVRVLLLNWLCNVSCLTSHLSSENKIVLRIAERYKWDSITVSSRSCSDWYPAWLLKGLSIWNTFCSWIKHIFRCIIGLIKFKDSPRVSTHFSPKLKKPTKQKIRELKPTMRYKTLISMLRAGDQAQDLPYYCVSPVKPW